MAEHNEVHLTNAENGHELSTDCWCEPTHIYWYTNQHGITMLVIEHVDYENLLPHAETLRRREMDRDRVTVILDSLFQ